MSLVGLEEPLSFLRRCTDHKQTRARGSGIKRRNGPTSSKAFIGVEGAFSGFRGLGNASNDYCYARPATTSTDHDIIRAFVAYELYTMHNLTLPNGDEIEFELASGFAAILCLGSEAAIKHFRRKGDFIAALRFGTVPDNWRQPDKRILRKNKHLFRALRKEAPKEFRELREIDLELFGTIMLPKMRAEGRLAS